MKCSWSENQKTFGVIKAWNENGESDDEDFLVLSVRTVFDKNGLESKEILNIGMGWEMIVNMNISVDSVRPVKFIKENVFHEIKLRYLILKKTTHWRKGLGICIVASLSTRSTSWERLSSGVNQTGGLVKKRRSSSQTDTNATCWGTITYKT